MVVVKEEFIAAALLRYVETEKIVVEGAAATGLGAILAGQLDELKGKKVVLHLCGGNIDSTTLNHCVERGLALDNRLIRFTIKAKGSLNDGIANLCGLVANCSCRVKSLNCERAWMQDIDAFTATVIVESANTTNSSCLKKSLFYLYECIAFNEEISTDKLTIHRDSLYEQK